MNDMMTNTNDTDRVKAEAKRAARIALLARSWEVDTATAATMVDAVSGLTDDEFQAHADFLAERRSSIKQAQQTSAKLPPQAGSPRPVKAAEQTRAKVRTEIDEYMSEQVFRLDDAESDEQKAR